jgi:hypothetical protein
MLTPKAVWAVHPLEVEETDTQGTGNYLFELNADLEKDNSVRSTKISGIITAGTGDNTDLSVQIPYLLLDPSPASAGYEHGVGDVRFKIKYRTNLNEVNQSSGFILYTDIPTGDADRGLGSNNVVWGLALMDQQVCHSNILRASIGYESLGRDTKRWHYTTNYAVRFGFDVEHKITESFRVLTEIAGESRKAFNAAEDTLVRTGPLTFLAGFKYDISKSWYVDLSARAGLNKYAEDYTALAGTAWRF